MKQLVFFLLLAHAVSLGQLVDPPEVAALPAWPASGELPTNLADKHVFRDPATGEIVVSYPKPDDPKERTTFRFSLANRVNPIVTVETSAATSGLFSYQYTLQNGPDAETPIRMWAIVGPPDDPDREISHPTWRSSHGRTPTASQAAIPGAPNGAHLFWHNWDSPVPVAGTVSSFRIDSSYLPGLTTAYAVGDGILTVPEEPPEEVLIELQPFQQPPVKWRPALTIGPRFQPGTTLEELAAQFRADLEAVIQAGTLSGQSAFLRELLGRLTKAAMSGEFPAGTAQAAPGVEAEIARALGLALQRK